MIAGQPAFSVSLAGTSPVTGAEETVTVMTRELPDRHVVYVLTVAPASDEAALAPVFQHMAGSLRINEGASHR